MLLDVYKRQFHGCNIERWLVAVVFLHPLLHVVTLGYASCSAEVRAVSYTHLDVYKRQPMRTLYKQNGETTLPGGVDLIFTMDEEGKS